ncbi:MAG: fused MFS/spermidine synthase [Roseiflexus sp.]|nr:fused MFS/spermidine synthase [Roseiflexus sp.]
MSREATVTSPETNETMTRSARAAPILAGTVFLCGVGTLGVEMIASRLLAPYFGTSQPIWAAIIGLTLVYLAVGYHLGGRLADRYPDERLLYRIVLLSGVATALIPPLAVPILSFAQQATAQLAVGGFLGALFGVLALFAVPVTLLAMVGPFAVRLQLHRAAAGVKVAGAAAGTVSAISTIGSIVGTFLTVLVLIPAIGTAATTYVYAGLLVVLGAAGARSWGALAALALTAALAGYTLFSPRPVKSAGCDGCTLIAEYESPYNYIQVATRQDPEYGQQVVLLLNEGLAIHSIYNTAYDGNPLDTLTGGGPWDYFAIAPFVVPGRDPASVRSLAMLGSAAGTTPAQFLAIFGPETHIDAVEIDPVIIEVGRRFFNMRDAATGPDHPNYRVYAEDARYWLATRGGIYDVIGMDAYHQPYIPFHLTTVEFFQLVRQHLAPDGVAVVNAGLGPNGDDRLSQAIVATMEQVFPQVIVIETARLSNQIIIGVTREIGDGYANLLEAYERLEHPALRRTLERVYVPTRRSTAVHAPFTDDRAPVERLVDSLIFETLTR